MSKTIILKTGSKRKTSVKRNIITVAVKIVTGTTESVSSRKAVAVKSARNSNSNNPPVKKRVNINDLLAGAQKRSLSNGSTSSSHNGDGKKRIAANSSTKTPAKVDSARPLSKSTMVKNGSSLKKSSLTKPNPSTVSLRKRKAS